MKHSQRLLPLVCVLAIVCVPAAQVTLGQRATPVADRVLETPDEKVRVTLPGNVHPLAREEFSRGPVADSLPMNRILLLLKRSDEQEAALQSLLEAQQDKSSPNYHKWLAPEEFGRQFGPSDGDLRAVTDWLTTQGFQNIGTGLSRNVIEFSGTAGQVRQAFTTTIQNYEVNGKWYVANAVDPQIPEALAPVVSGIVSLHNFPKTAHNKFLGDVQRDSTNGKLQPLYTFPEPNFGDGNFYGVGPGDFATIYNSKALIASGNDGTGQTIAIVGETQINPSDVGDFRTMFGLINNFPASNVILNGMDPGITSPEEESEADLDTQWSGAVAPGATIKYVVSASTPASAGIDLSALYIVEHNLADVMSLSYGECESNLGSGGNAFYKTLWEQAAAQGITVVVSSGDAGSAGCDDFGAQPPTPATHGLAVSGIAGTPFNVSAGGTDFDQVNVWSTYWNTTNDSATGTSAKNYIPEIPWNESCAQLGLTGCGSTAPNGSVNIVAGSGGASSVYSKPTWQMGVNGVPNDNHRDQPDISLFASPGFTGSGYLICQKDLTSAATCDLSQPHYTFHTIGGTSAAAPAFAGVMALVNQYSAAHGGTSRQGNANLTLYALAKKSGNSCTSSATELAGCVFNDVTKGNTYLATKYGKSVGTNSVPCTGGTPNCSATLASSTGVLVDPSHTTTEAWTAAAGYDLATGLGSVNIGNLASTWNSASTIGTSTTLALSPTTGITHGTGENVSVNVTVKPTTGSGVPSGDVALLAKLADGSILGVGQFTLANGAVTSVKTQSLPGGTYNVYAHYTGDGTNAPSDSAQVPVTVGKESSQTFIVIPTFDSQGNQTSGNATSVTYGSSYIIRMYVANSSATASASGPPSPTCATVNDLTCPTGTVSLSGNGNPIDGGTFTLNNNGYTRDIAPILTGGKYSLVAKYGGDNSYITSTSATDAFTVTPAVTQTQMDSYPVNVVQGQTFQLEVNVTSQLVGSSALVAYPSGTVTFYDGSAPLPGTVQITHGGNGQIYADIYNISLTVPGPHIFTAQYSGDNNYGPSTSSPVTTTVLIKTAITLSVTATNINYGQSINATAVMTSDSKGPAITGQIYFGGGFPTFTNVVTTAGTDASGNQTLTVTGTTVPPGTESIYAAYQGDANYALSSTAGDLITVNIPDFSLAPANGLMLVPVAGQPLSGQVTITPLSQTASTVQISLNQTPVISGYAISLSSAQVNLNGSPVAATLTMTPTTSVSTTAIKASTRQTLLPAPRGGDWRIRGFAAGLFAILLVSWSRRIRRRRMALVLTEACLLAVALGCGGGGGSTLGGGGGTVSTPPGPTSITLTTTNARSVWGNSFTITAAVTASKPLTGSLTFYDFGNPITNSGLTNGQAQIGWGNLTTVGIHQITASYSGDSGNLPSTSTQLTQIITGTTSIAFVGATGVDAHYLPITIGVQ